MDLIPQPAILILLIPNRFEQLPNNFLEASFDIVHYEMNLGDNSEYVLKLCPPFLQE